MKHASSGAPGGSLVSDLAWCDSGGVFERFTERARQVVVLAQEESRMLAHAYIGTEHVLLGLLREEEGQAARALATLGVSLDPVRAQVLQLVGRGEGEVAGQIPFTPRATRVLELSLRESLNLGHDYVGTEHILLGLVRENEGVASRILLTEFEADAERIRNEVIRLLSGSGSPFRASEEVAPRQLIDQAWFGELAGILNGLAKEIRGDLGRAPDTGDLLLVLACTSNTIAAQALSQLGVDRGQLSSGIKRAREEAPLPNEKLAERVEDLRARAEEATQSQEFGIAARLRDEIRRLVQAHDDAIVPSEIVEAIRRNLGLSTRDDQPPECPPTPR